VDFIRSLRPVVESLAVKDKDLADQLQRAATSACLNLAEGSRRSTGDQRRLYTYANGSAMEARAALEAAEAWGWVGDVAEPRHLLDRLLGLLWGLAHQERAPARRHAGCC
jgi:four helix bundle protein